MDAEFLWNGPLEINPDGGYRPAPCRSGGSIRRATDGIITEPVTIPSRPSDEFIQTLRDMGASQGTIDRALGIKPPRWWRR